MSHHHSNQLCISHTDHPLCCLDKPFPKKWRQVICNNDNKICPCSKKTKTKQNSVQGSCGPQTIKRQAYHTSTGLRVTCSGMSIALTTHTAAQWHGRIRHSGVTSRTLLQGTRSAPHTLIQVTIASDQLSFADFQLQSGPPDKTSQCTRQGTGSPLLYQQLPVLCSVAQLYPCSNLGVWSKP